MNFNISTFLFIILTTTTGWSQNSETLIKTYFIQKNLVKSTKLIRISLNSIQLNYSKKTDNSYKLSALDTVLVSTLIQSEIKDPKLTPFLKKTESLEVPREEIFRSYRRIFSQLEKQVPWNKLIEILEKDFANQGPLSVSAFSTALRIRLCSFYSLNNQNTQFKGCISQLEAKTSLDETRLLRTIKVLKISHAFVGGAYEDALLLIKNGDEILPQDRLFYARYLILTSKIDQAKTYLQKNKKDFEDPADLNHVYLLIAFLEQDKAAIDTYLNAIGSQLSEETDNNIRYLEYLFYKAQIENIISESEANLSKILSGVKLRPDFHLFFFKVLKLSLNPVKAKEAKKLSDELSQYNKAASTFTPKYQFFLKLYNCIINSCSSEEKVKLQAEGKLKFPNDLFAKHFLSKLQPL